MSAINRLTEQVNIKHFYSLLLAWIFSSEHSKPDLQTLKDFTNPIKAGVLIKIKKKNNLALNLTLFNPSKVHGAALKMTALKQF